MTAAWQILGCGCLFWRVLENDPAGLHFKVLPMYQKVKLAKVERVQRGKEGRLGTKKSIKKLREIVNVNAVPI